MPRLSYLVVLVVFMLATRSVYACGKLDLVCTTNDAVNGWIAGKTSAATGGAVASIKPEIDEVLSQQLPAIVSQLSAAVGSGIITAQQAGDELTDHVTKALNDSFAKGENFKNEFFSQLSPSYSSL